MIFHQIDFSGELQDILSRLKEEEDRLADQILRLDVSPREMPPEGREELAAALAAMKQYLLQLEAIRQKLLVLSADVEMQLDMYQMPEIYGPPEFFGIFADKEETP